MRICCLLLCFAVLICSGQNPYPQDYFSNPIDIPLVLAGTFGELRTNHFHSGIDIKTNQRKGLPVYAVAEGFVSRIKISTFGYGKALYITHPNGYTTVYGHLQKFSPEIEAYIKKLQYKKESFEVETFPAAGILPITRQQLIAYSGNSGSSGGPHLHFEIRDREEFPLNPLLFGIDISDTKRPVISNLYAYPLDDNAHVNNKQQRQNLRLVPLNDGNYTVETISACGNIGFGIVTIDQQNGANNKNGVYTIESFYNGSKNFEIDFKRFSFFESRHLNRYIDYEVFKTEKERIQKLFVEQNNPLSLYSNVSNNGILNIKDQTASVYKIRVADYKGNETWVTINIAGQVAAETLNPELLKTPHYIYANQETMLHKEQVTVTIPENTFYDDFYMHFDVKNDTLTLHEPIIPVIDYFSIAFDVSRFSESHIKQLYIAELSGYSKYPSYSKTTRKDNKLITRTRDLGIYTLAMDTINPIITPINFNDGKWISNNETLTLKIDDKPSGISAFRATVNGKWILMEYDYKTNTLIHDFSDGVVTETKNNFKLIVTDNVGNSTTFEAAFFRK